MKDNTDDFGMYSLTGVTLGTIYGVLVSNLILCVLLSLGTGLFLGTNFNNKFPQ